MAEGGGVQAGNEREGAAVQEVGASVRVSTGRERLIRTRLIRSST